MRITRKIRVTIETRRIVVTAHAVRNVPDRHSDALAQPASPAAGVPGRGRVYGLLRAKLLACLAGLRGWFPFL